MIRCFLIGSPRSGTTLLQSMLASHPAVWSLPETHFFPSVWTASRILRVLGIVERPADALARLRDLGFDEPRVAEWPASRWTRTYVKRFVALLDDRARADGRCAWVEKTPRHLHYMSLIGRYVPEPRFVHILRGGAAVVASQYQVTRDHSEAWRGAREVDTCLNRWISDVRISERAIDRPGHQAVLYERLVQDPSRELQRICLFLGMGYDDAMIVNSGERYAGVRVSGSLWTDDVASGIRPVAASRFREVFDESTRAYVMKRIDQAGLADLERIFACE